LHKANLLFSLTKAQCLNTVKRIGEKTKVGKQKSGQANIASRCLSAFLVKHTPIKGEKMRQYGSKNLTYIQRIQLEQLYNAGIHKKIIEQLGVCLATVYNELKRGRCEQKKLKKIDWFGDKHYKSVESYSAYIGQERYKCNMSACGPDIKLGKNYEFVNYFEKRVLQDKIAPCAVLGEIKRNNVFEFTISKTTLYRYIAKDIFGNIRMQDLTCRRREKRYRKTVIKRPNKGTSIEKRPIEISHRDTFGHWEMDCVLGKRETGNVLLTLTERLTRYEIIMLMPDRKATTVVKCLNKLEKQYGSKFRKVFKSITVDNGSEFSDFAGLERSIYRGKRTSIYYCHPYSSSERGTNERLNREIRRLLPKKKDFDKLTNKDVQSVENWINIYPRKIFDYAPSFEIFNNQLNKLN